MAKAKNKRRVYHVVRRAGTVTKSKKGVSYGDVIWEVKAVGAKRASAVCDKKLDAIAKAKKIAKKFSLSQVVIHGIDGKIQREFTYGKDPKHIPG